MSAHAWRSPTLLRLAELGEAEGKIPSVRESTFYLPGAGSLQLGAS